MSKQKWFKREILERFMDEEELKEFLGKYEMHKIVRLGRKQFNK